MSDDVQNLDQPHVLAHEDMELKLRFALSGQPMTLVQYHRGKPMMDPVELVVTFTWDELGREWEEARVELYGYQVKKNGERYQERSNNSYWSPKNGPEWVQAIVAEARQNIANWPGYLGEKAW